MGSLRDTLNSLPLQGHHAVQARRAELDDLVTNGLTNGEIRHLLQRLNGEKDRFSVDLCGELPVEILLQIIKYLDVHELIRARRVCRKWNDKFSSPDFCIEVIKIHFRGTWESFYDKSLVGAEEKAEKLRLTDWLPRAAKRRIRRKLGHYNQIDMFQTERSNQDTVESIPQYSNGRVAYKNRGGIFVWDLEGSSNIVFMDPDRQALGQWLLSDELLLAKKKSSLTMFVWPLSQNAAPDTKRYAISLYSNLKFISASGFEVGMMTSSNEILLWDISSGLRKIDVSTTSINLPQPTLLPFGLVLHPTKPKHLFIFYGNQRTVETNQHITDFPRKVSVQEITSQGDQTVYSSEVEAPDDLDDATYFDMDIVSPIDANGLYGILWQTFHSSIIRPQLLLTFNIYTKEVKSVQQTPLDVPRQERILAGDDDYVLLASPTGYLVWWFKETAQEEIVTHT